MLESSPSSFSETFNPAFKDGKLTQGIAPTKAHWALCLDKPPFVAYGVRDHLFEL